jgi:uncharacterized protein (UPF0332 family)
LLATARKLARSEYRPRQADLKRAVSTAYYALFHFLAQECADLLVGTGRARGWPCWQHVHRSLEHGFAKTACGEVTNLKFPAEIIQFATFFIAMQEERHNADYDPQSRYSRAEVMGFIDGAEQAIADYKKAERSDKKAFAVQVMLRKQKKQADTPRNGPLREKVLAKR